MKTPKLLDLEHSKKEYVAPRLKKIGKLKSLTLKTGSTMDALTATNAYSM